MPTTWARLTRAPLAAVSFAAARVRARPTRGLVTGVGIAVALAALFVTTAAPLIAGDATLRRAVGELAPGARSITVAVSVNTRTPEQLRTIDAQVRTTLRARALGSLRAEVEYRALASGDGTVFRLAGLDDLATAVTMISGRLPTECTPTHCEVVIIGATTAVTPQPALGIDVVGRAVLDDPTVLAGSFSPDPTEVVLLGDGVQNVGGIISLELIGRSLGWIAPLDSANVRVADINGILAAATRTANTFADGGGTVDVPRSALVGARSRAETARNRVALAAAQGALLMVAFAVLAAASMRRQHRAARELLGRRGASRATTNVFTICEAAWPVAIGLLIGVPLGLGVSAWLADSWNLPAGNVVAEVVRSSLLRVALGTVGVLLVTAAVMAATPRMAGAGQPKQPWWWPHPIDLFGLGSLGAAALALQSEPSTPDRLVANGASVLAALPLLAGITVAWVAIRIVPLLVAATGRALRGRAPLARTALGEVGRRPAVPVVTAGFVAAATMLGLFALGYRSTLAAGAHDQAAFAVPLDITLTEGPALVRPLALEPTGGWSTLAAGTTGTEVVRRGATVRSRQLTNDTVDVVGIDPPTLGELRSWRRDFGPDPSGLATAITPAQISTVAGTRIPADATHIVLHGSGDLAITELALVVERRDGSWHEVATTFDPTVPGQVVADLAPTDAGGRLIGFRLAQPGFSAEQTEHHIGEGLTTTQFFTATVQLDSIDATNESTRGSTGAAVALDWAGLGSDGALVTHRPQGLDIALRLQGSAALVLPPRPSALGQITAIVDPATAAAADNGAVVLDLPGGNRMSVRVAGVANRFPGAASRFVIVDRAQIQLAFDLFDPGFGTPNELWLAAPSGGEQRLAAALRNAPYDQLVLSRRSVIESTLRSDPLARFTLGLFAVAGLIAGLLAIAAIHLATSADAAEQAPLHRALAAEGVSPSALSRMVRIAAGALAVGAILIGTTGALVLLRVVTRVIAVTAASTVPVPPLVASVPATNLLIALAVFTVPCLLAAAIAARAARRAAHGDLLREFG